MYLKPLMEAESLSMNTQTLQRPLKYTYDDYLQLPEEKRFELIQGDLVMVPSPSEGHQDILGRLYMLINSYVVRSGPRKLDSGLSESPGIQ
ncbi:MAG: hypothetical protein GC154_20710 [bacterium]|nr:hypothetical protein [bacterium]